MIGLILTGLLLIQQPVLPPGYQLPEVTVPVNPKPHDLTLQDVIAILADYDVKHADQQPFFMPAYGVTNFDSNPPAVWVFNTSDTVSKRSTVIHEFLHIYYHQLGLEASEEFIRQEETRLYLQIFGQGNHQ